MITKKLCAHFLTSSFVDSGYTQRFPVYDGRHSYVISLDYAANENMHGLFVGNYVAFLYSGIRQVLIMYTVAGCTFSVHLCLRGLDVPVENNIFSH